MSVTRHSKIVRRRGQARKKKRRSPRRSTRQNSLQGSKQLSTKHVQKSAFLCYRQSDGYSAWAIFQNLTHRGFDVFFDHQSIANGDFEHVILSEIRERAHFLVLLTPSALERCNDPMDWFRREIEEAIDTNRSIVPLMMEDFDFDAPPIKRKLTGKLARLKRYNGLTVPKKYFNEAMTNLRKKFLK